MTYSRIDPRMTQMTQTARNPVRCQRNAPETVRMGRLTIRLQSSGLRQARHCQPSSATETRRSPASSNHPIITHSSARKHPSYASPRLHTWSESTDNRPIFRGESSESTPEIVRNRQTTGAESSGRSFSPSRHFSRQNGERDEPRSLISSHPAIFPAMLRDRGSSDDSSPLTGEKCADYGKRIVAAVGRQLGRSHFQSDIHVAEYLTALPPRELLQQKPHAAIEISRARLVSQSDDATPFVRKSRTTAVESKRKGGKA